MLGYVSYGDGSKRPELKRRQLLGVTFTVLHMGEVRRPEALLAKSRAMAAARRLRNAGVRQAVFPMDFPYVPLFARQGVYPMDVLPQRQVLAVPLLQRRLTAMGLTEKTAVVAISGHRAGRALVDAVTALALRYRYVMLDVPSGGEELARALRREYGASLLLQPGAEQLERADALLLYGQRGDLHGRNPVIYSLYPGGEQGWEDLNWSLPGELARQVEANCCREQLLAALQAAGVLPLENILAEIDVDRTGKYLYNANA